MKQILLVGLFALPTLALAQPTLTFVPADGATDVSITNNLTIDSNERLKTTSGVNVDNTNVEALISLLDANLNQVAFGATINGAGDKITINPAASLLEKHTYTLILQPVENSAGAETTTKTITFTTEDITDPVFNQARAIDNTGTGFTFRVNVDEAATVYYVVDRDGSTPTVTQVRNGDKANGSNAEASGSFIVTANTDATATVSGLDFTPPVKFNVYFFAEDNASPKNVTSVTRRGIPLLNSSSIPAASVEPFQFDLRVNIDEAVTTYYVVTQSATAPTATQIIAGQNEAGTSPVAGGSFPVAAGNTNTDQTIAGLNDATTYYVHFVSTDAEGNQTIIKTQSATTPDGTGPVIVSLSPMDNATGIDISTSTFTMTFDENAGTINAAATSDNQRIRLFENGVVVETIDRDDTTVGATGSVVADGTSASAVITFVYQLQPNENYYIVIGNQVFQDAASNPFAGLATASGWNFSTSGVSVNNLTSNICSGSFQNINNIVISETGVADFNNGANQTLILSLDNTSEFVISNSGVSVTGLSADITSLSVSVTLSSLTVTYSAIGGTVLDNITISGLKVYATGAVPSATIIRTGGSADQDGNNGTGASSLIYSNINVGATPPSQPQLAASQDLVHCVNENITSKTLTLVDQGVAVTYNWYRDAGLSDLAVSTANETVNIATDLGLASPAVFGNYKFYVVAISACQSVPPVEIIIQVGANPVADAGADQAGPSAVCTGTELTLGGNPTLAIPSAPGAYTYLWSYVESTPEPDPVANPKFTVTNNSPTASAIFNFEVRITDANGCVGVDTKTVEVKPTFDVWLQSPNSYTFTPNAPNQTLVASPPDGVFSGVGVVQSNAPSTYQFSPSIAHATDPNTLPKNFNIYYTITQNGCTKSNYLIATFTIANSFFSTLQPQYCGNEYPDPNQGVALRLDDNAYTYVDNRKISWNTSERFSRGPYNTAWQAGVSYAVGSYVNYNSEIYKCQGGALLLPCSGLTAPDSDPVWLQENILKVAFNGWIANYYEDYYGGNSPASTVVKTATTYTVLGNTLNEYKFGTNINYNNCPTCNYGWPAAYLEFERPEDLRIILPDWYATYYYYRGDLVKYLGRVYQCTANPYTTGTAPDVNPGLWSDVTDGDYSNGQYFHKQVSPGVFKSGFYVNGQYVQVNPNPTVFFSGLTSGQVVCEFDVLYLDNQGSSTGIKYDLTGNFSNQNLIQEFSVRLEGSGVYDNGGGAIANNIVEPGKATFDTRLAFVNSTTGNTSPKAIEIRYRVDPGTRGSASQACYGTSSLVVQVAQNRSFDFDDTVVDANGATYCYTESAKGLRSVFNGLAIGGAAGSPNSVSYSGYGVNDFGNSLGAFRPGVAVDQISPNTSVQQLIPVTALYRDANQCRSTRVRTFKVNPDIQPSFSFAGRVNYCYEDALNPFSGHTQDFTVNSATVSSAGRYNIVYRDPGGTIRNLETINSNNTDFIAKTYYDQIQNILSTNGFSADMNQSVSLNTIYIETLTTDSVCRESFVQAMTINPPTKLDIFGITDKEILCRNSNTDVTQGNVINVEGSVSGFGIFKLDDDADFALYNPTLNGAALQNAGKASINLLTAYNAASDNTDPRRVYIQYEYTAPGCTGPADVVKYFEISPPPAISFSGANPSPADVLCYDDAPIQLNTNESVNVALSGYGITDSGTGIGQASLDPELAFQTSVSNGGSLNSQQNITVTARIIDGLGCANIATAVYKVNPIPTAVVNFDKKDFCYEDAAGLIAGEQVNSWYSIEYLGGTTPYTEYIGNQASPVSQIQFDPKPRFDEATGVYGASALTPVKFNVYYNVADADNCTNMVGPTVVTVANRIDVAIAGLDNNDIFCSNETNGEKVLTFNPFPVDPSKRRFSIDGGVQTLTSDKFTFRPALMGGDYVFEYVVFSGQNNCSNTASVSVKVLPSPEAIFNPEPACEGELIEFRADGTNNLSSALYTWTLIDSVRTGQTIQHRFPGTNLYGVTLKVEYPAYNNDPALVCQASLRRDQVVGSMPGTLNFDHFNVCEGNQTTFNIEPDIPISQVRWNFDDGTDTGLGYSADQITGVPETSGTYQAPVHKFPGQGNYAVVVTGKTAEIFGGCELTETHYIDILKIWSRSAAEPYYDMSQLNGGNGFWVVEDVAGNSSWEFAASAKARINTGEMAWVTDRDNPYRANDISYVNSPCFDLSAFSRPVLSLKHWADTESSDGAVLQYSIDGGENWERLGEVASGLEWYNRLTISANPGEQNDVSSGWSSAEQQSWAVGKHTLDVIDQARRTQVRFRVAFASFNNREGRDGFAFNNVIIEGRNRTILVENFTNKDAVNNNNEFKRFRADNSGFFNPAELVKLQYHHAAAVTNAQEDNLHLDNPVDQNARAAFYGVTNPVKAFVDGGFGQISTNSTFQSPGLNNYFSLRSLVTSPVDIAIDFLPELDPARPEMAQLNVKATVQATNDLGAPGQYNIFIAIAEQSVDGQIFVLRKFLPDASGTPLTSLSATDPAQEIKVSYDMRHVTRLTNGEFAPFAVIVFVQHLRSKDVLQTVMRTDGAASSEIVTGIETSRENYIRIYPNPADNVLNVMLPAPVTADSPLSIFDTFGREVYSGWFSAGEYAKALEIKSLSGGVYLIQLSTPQGLVQKKAMVVHE